MPLWMQATHSLSLTDRVTYQDHNISFFGFYKPKVGEEKVSGLEAEMLARSEGKNYIAKYLKGNCGSDELKENWQSAFHSQGSVIDSNGNLKILMQAKMKDVFKDGESCK